MATLIESITNPFLTRAEENPPELSSAPDVEKVEQELSNIDDIAPTGFFDDAANNRYGASKKENANKKQKELIQNYRRIGNFPEVDGAVNEIINESIFAPTELKHPILLDWDDDETPINVQEAVQKEFDEICSMINIEKNLYSMYKTFYIDGQLNIHMAYDDAKIKKGIQTFKILSPIGLSYNYTKDRWEYQKDYTDYSGFTKSEVSMVFDKEEIIRVDSGIYHDQLVLSNLHHAIKPANMLQTLEDMLIPMRFSRSVSRRVFNVDVANLNNKKAEEVMARTQAKFKYKKFYDVENGTIANQQHVSALTEDYWFPNRDGQKGTTVDTIDETGNLGEITDIIYFKKKLYTSLKVPTTRITDEDSQSEFSFDDSSINREEVKFFAFVTRIRKQFLQLFYEILKRQLIAKGTMKLEDWTEISKNLVIKFATENAFYEKMKRETLTEQLSQYQDVEELVGKFFSHRYVFKEIFKMTDDEIKDLADEIENEKTDPLYARFQAPVEGEDETW